ncbi:MAG: BatD family protein [Pseudomonadota bacterium]|nr:BatD family protein [Pseudomonadota bacterium]
MSRVTDPATAARGYKLVPAILRMLIVLLLSLASLNASAQVRAWLDRDRINADETVTLNIEMTGSGSPDYSPLQKDFSVSGHTSRRQLEIVNGRASSRTLFAVALRPRRDGVITVPALEVGSGQTQPLSLVVTPGQARIPARAGDDVFIESEADDTDPYVQQSAGWVVRLYSAVPLVSGQLEQPAPDGASLQQVGDDVQYDRQIEGRRYQVVERRFLLIPERSGSLTIPGATFQGRGVAGFFDDFLGSGRSQLQAQAAPRFLQVRPIPPNARQPWLPLHSLQLRYQSTPQELREGSASTLTIEVTADGATAAQMPELELPPIDGVQVFAEPVQADERFVQGRPRVTLTRSFSLVPSRAGEVRLAGLRLQWWDVEAGAARTEALPPMTWNVVAGGGTPATAGASAAPQEPKGAADAIRSAQQTPRAWVLAAVGFALLWLLTLAWAVQRRPSSAAEGSAALGSVGTPAAATREGRASTARFKRALDTGDFAEVAAALCALARPPASDLDEVRARLDEPAQREALDAMQRARWGGGDGVDARSRLRAAFRRGPVWRRDQPTSPPPLPPLYPPGG